MVFGKSPPTSWATSTNACTSSDDAWYQWNRGWSQTTAAIRLSMPATYAVTSSASCTSFYTDQAWLQWNSGWHYARQRVPVPAVVRRAPVPLTPEETAAMRAREAAEVTRRAAEREAQQRAEQAKIAAAADASSKARKLLVQCLSPEQRATFEQHSYFDVETPDGRHFRIKKGWSHNVYELTPDKKPVRSLCAHPAEQVPDYDNMLAQKFWLETSPEHFLRVANKGPLLVN